MLLWVIRVHTERQSRSQHGGPRTDGWVYVRERHPVNLVWQPGGRADPTEVKPTGPTRLTGGGAKGRKDARGAGTDSGERMEGRQAGQGGRRLAEERGTGKGGNVCGRRGLQGAGGRGHRRQPGAARPPTGAGGRHGGTPCPLTYPCTCCHSDPHSTALTHILPPGSPQGRPRQGDGAGVCAQVAGQPAGGRGPHPPGGQGWVGRGGRGTKC